MARKLTEEEKAEKKALKELDELTEEMAKDEETEKALKQVKKDEKKFGKRVHIEPQSVIHCRATFIEPVLGGSPGDEQIYSSFIGSKAPDKQTLEEEVAMFGQEDVEKQGTTIFMRDKKGRYCLLEHQLRGYLKSAAQALKRAGLLEITAHEKVITQLVKFSAKPDLARLDRWIPLIPPKGTRPSLNQRPLRGQTAQGERTALASSEELPAGTMFEFYIHLLTKKVEPTVLSWMEYGKYVGLLQWRSAGYGRFTVEVERGGKWIPLEEA